MASIVVTGGVVGCMDGSIDLDTDTIKVMLLKSSYTPDKDHKFVSSLSASECDATNYTGGFAGAGRKTLSSKTVTEDTTNDRSVFDAADPSAWTALGGASNNTIQYLAFIKEVTNDAASRVICICDFAAQATNGGDITIVLNSLGAFYVQC